MERIIWRWRLFSPPVYTGILAFVGIAYLLVHHLASITNGQFARSEVQALATHPSWRSIWHNMLDAPYFAALRLAHYGSHTPFYNRLVATSIGFLAAAFLYFVLQRWVGWRLGTLGAVLFGTSGALLHTARLVNPGVMQLLGITFLLAWYAWSHKQPKPKHLIVVAFGISLLLYTPGVVILALLAIWLNHRSVGAMWLQASTVQQTFVVAMALILLAPLGYYLSTHGLHTALTWLGYGLPLSLSALMEFVRGLGYVPLHLFVRGNNDGVFGLAHQALINAPVSFLGLLGLYVSLSRFREGRWRFIVLLLIACWLLAALSGINEATLAPLIYILATVGLAYLLSDWYRVFPRNPIARSLGMLFIVLVVALSSWYELRSYFVAWPHNEATTAAFVCPPVTLPAQGCNLVQ